MGMKVVITPKFDVKKITEETLGKFWIEFQLYAFNLAEVTLKYMQNYISTNHKRSGGTGKLANSIELWRNPDTTGKIEWGIGHIPTLNERTPYWYVINFGKKITGELFRPNNGKFVPGTFADGTPKSELKGRGTSQFNFGKDSNAGIKPGVIRPMYYIENAKFHLEEHLAHLLERLRRI